MYIQMYTSVCGSGGIRLRVMRICGIGASIEFASLIFDGPTKVVEDRRRDYGEKRVVAIGLADGMHLTVVYTDRFEGSRSERRIISARRSNRRERQTYRKATASS